MNHADERLGEVEDQGQDAYEEIDEKGEETEEECQERIEEPGDGGHREMIPWHPAAKDLASY